MGFNQRFHKNVPQRKTSIYANEINSSKELADSYISQMTNLLKEALLLFKQTGHASYFLCRCFKDFYKIKNYKGIHCCNDNYIQILVDGSICSCAYAFDKIGDIWNLDKINLNKIIENNIKLSCKSCTIFNICRNSCCKNITNHECYIKQQMYENMKKYLQQYDVSYQELDIESLKIM